MGWMFGGLAAFKAALVNKKYWSSDSMREISIRFVSSWSLWSAIVRPSGKDTNTNRPFGSMIPATFSPSTQERALASNASADEFRKGVNQIHLNLGALLKSYGLREIPANDKFDPSLHEALSIGEGEEGKILEVYQKGYCLGTRVLRHSKVKVGVKPETTNTE